MKTILDKLVELGMEQEEANALVEAEKSKYIPVEEHNTTKAEIEVYKTNADTLNETIKNLEKEVGLSETLKLQIEDYKTKMADKDNQINKIKYEAKLEVELNKANARSIKALKAMLDMEKISMDDNGAIVGLEEQLTSLRETDDYLFAEANKPAGLGSSKTNLRKNTTKNPFSREHFNVSEQCRLMKENPVLAQQLRDLAK